MSKQKSIRKYLLLLTILNLFYTLECYAQEYAVPPLDIVLVLDNSGSMRKNDPGYLARKAVMNFLEGLPYRIGDSQIGFVVFSESPELATDLMPAAEADTREEITRILDGVNYTGHYTNIPAAIERAIYGLKQNGRKNAEKLIILMTDGIIDTGDPTRDLEKQRWLKDDLAEESRSSDIRIFGIAFSDEADFELIQTLGLKTHGGYYRAFKAEDIQGVFDSINKIISTPKLKETILKQKLGAESPPQPGIEVPQPKVIVEVPTTQKKGFSEELLVVGLVVAGLTALFIIVVLVTLLRGKKMEAGQDLSIPEAKLWDINEQYLTDKEVHDINKKITTIGRSKSEDGDICIDKKTVSASHAQIKYEHHDKRFYLLDLGSTNGTYVNGSIMSIPKFVPIPLKSGDIISLTHPDTYKFEFIMPGWVKRGDTQMESV